MTTQALKDLLYQEEMDEAILLLLTINHADLSAPIRVCSDAVDVESNGNTFLTFPFNISLPIDAPNEPPRAKLQIDNIDRQIVQTIRSISSAPTITIELIRSGDPDTIEVSLSNYTLINVTYDVRFVQGDLVLDDLTPYVSS